MVAGGGRSRFTRVAQSALAAIAAVASFGAHGQQLTQNFDDITTLAAAGWIFTNNSNAVGATGWFQGNSAIFPSQAGATNSYVAANFLNAGLGGNISNWLLSPALTTLQNGETLSFYTRTSATTSTDRLEVRLCIGASCTSVGTTDASVGSFTTLLFDINPTQAAATYPTAWTKYSVVLSGLPVGSNSGRIGMRFFVTNTNAGGDYIGIDTLNLTGLNVAPTLQGVVSRRAHGAAGSFSLPLAATPLNPTTEPRQGPTHSIVFTFDKPVNAAVPSVSEGTATVGTATFSGNDVVVPLSGVLDQQYVTISLGAVGSTDGGTGGTGSVRLGFLAGDVNQSRVVTLTDVGQVNAQLAQAVTAANYLKDVNVSGTLSLADKVITNSSLTHALPPP